MCVCVRALGTMSLLLNCSPLNVHHDLLSSILCNTKKLLIRPSATFFFWFQLQTSRKPDKRHNVFCLCIKEIKYMYIHISYIHRNKKNQNRELIYIYIYKYNTWHIQSSFELCAPAAAAKVIRKPRITESELTCEKRL